MYLSTEQLPRPATVAAPETSSLDQTDTQGIYDTVDFQPVAVGRFFTADELFGAGNLTVFKGHRIRNYVRPQDRYR